MYMHKSTVAVKKRLEEKGKGMKREHGM